MPTPRARRAALPLLLAAALAWPSRTPAGSAERCPSPEALRAEGLALAARDDTASLSRAAALLDEAYRTSANLYQARADRALVEILVAAARQGEGSRSSEGAALLESGRDLRERALEELRPLAREHPEDPVVLRALALYYATGGDAPQTALHVARARAAGDASSWLDLAEIVGSAQLATPDVLVARLATFSVAHPEILRARFLAARLELERARTEQALARLDELLTANPGHDLASDLKATLLAPPSTRVTVVPSGAEAPLVRHGGHLPRKPVHPGGAGGTRGDLAGGMRSGGNAR